MFTNITRTTLCITAFSIASLMAAPLDATKTESLDWNWKFARFGKMPDGSTQPEPGKAMGFATATSEESGNPADNAVDGDKSTRWCADGGKSGEKITVDMGRPVDVKTVNILWEKQNNHLFKLEGSGVGKRWTTIEDILPVFNRGMILKSGEIVAHGSRDEVLTEENLKDAFELDIQLIKTEKGRLWTVIR